MVTIFRFSDFHRNDRVAVVDVVPLIVNDQIEIEDFCFAIHHVHSVLFVELKAYCFRIFFYFLETIVESILKVQTHLGTRVDVDVVVGFRKLAEKKKVCRTCSFLLWSKGQ